MLAMQHLILQFFMQVLLPLVLGNHIVQQVHIAHELSFIPGVGDFQEIP